MSSVVECNTTPVADALKSLELTPRQKQVLQFLKAFIAAKGAIYLTKGSARGITVA